MSVINGVSYNLPDRLIPADGLLVSMAEHFDPFIVDYQMSHPSLWRDRIPRGTFPLYSGYTQMSYIFRGSLGPQAGLSDWSVIAPSVKPADGITGYDRCTYSPQTYTWAFEAVANSGYTNSWRSPIFCVEDLKNQDRAKDQLAMIVKAGAQNTDQVNETFNREMYIKMAVDSSKGIVLVDGLGVNFIDDADYRFEYDPFVVDADGNTYITFPSALLPRISTLNWNSLDLIRQYLTDQAPSAAVGMDAGMPVFLLMLDFLDFERYVLSDAALREDFRYARSQALIEGFTMGFKVYRGYAMLHDQRQPRYTIATNDGTDVTCTRVLPRRATRVSSVTGTGIPETNPEFIHAELGLMTVFLSKAMMLQVPPTVSNLGSGMVFGPQPGFSGEWRWLNIANLEDNPLNEKGLFFSRYEYHVKPLENAQYAMVILYRRCTQSLGTGCAVDTDSSSENSANLDKVPSADDFDGTNFTVILQLSNKLAAGLGDSVSIKKDDSVSFTAEIAEDHAAPIYKFVWRTGTTNKPSAITDMNDPAIVTVTVA